MGERLTLSIVETARLLGISKNLCYSRVKAGEIPVIKIGKRLLVPKKSLEKLLSEPQPLNLAPAGKWAKIKMP